MIRRWIGFGVALALGIAFRVAYTDWLAGFVLAFLLFLPLMGVLVSLPAVWSTKVTLAPIPAEGTRGERAGWMVEARSSLGLPLGRVRVKVRVKNCLAGGHAVYRETFFLPARGNQRRREGTAVHCGLFEGEIVSAWATDAFGLFWLPLCRRAAARQIILPSGQETVSPPLEEETVGTRPRPGGGPGEDYDPRDYRPGDPLNTIHWKLSAKRGDLIVRETLEDVRRPVVLLFDHFGTAEALDETLELLRASGESMLREGRSFAVAWADADSGKMRRFSVWDENSFRACLVAAVSEPARLTGRSVLDLPQIPGGVYLKAEGATT